MVASGWGKGRIRKLSFNDYRVSVWGDEKVLEIGEVVGQCECA